VTERPEIYVDFDTGADDAEADAVRKAFAEAGLLAQVSDQSSTLAVPADVGQLAQFLVIAMGTTAGVSFLKAFFTKAGEDGWKAFKDLIVRLRRTRPRDRGQLLVIIRQQDGLDILIPPDVPDEALRQLIVDPLPSAPSRTIVYLPSEGRWQDAG